MSVVLSSSVSAYRSFVRRLAESSAQSWIEQLDHVLPRTLTTLKEQQSYWETLTAMAELNWRGDDQRVAAAQEEGLRDYRRELDVREELPPSARYLLSHQNGDFVLQYVAESDPEPQELLQRHIEIIEEKEAVLRSMNRFFGALQSSTAEASASETSDSPLGLEGELMALRKSLVELKRNLIGLRLKLDQAKKRPVADTNSWNIVTSETIPVSWNKHVSVTRMSEKVKAANDVRSTLEGALNDLIGVKQDDAPDAVRRALAAIAVFEELDPDDTYDVRRSGQLGRTVQLELMWQGKKTSLANLAEARSLLQEILEEQDIISNTINVVLEFARQGVGLLLEADAFWNQVDSAPSPNGRVTVMWQELVRAGNQSALSRYLGGKALYLEQARRQGRFKDEPRCVRMQLDYLLDGSVDHASFETKIPSQSFLELLQKLKTRQSWSLKEICVLLERTLSPYVSELRRMPVEANSPWPPADKRLTLSRGAYNLVVQAVRHSEHLAHVMTWLHDFELNLANWAELRDKYVGQIMKTEPGHLQTSIKEKLRDLCPEYPDYKVLNYEAKTPPLTPRS